ncbi:MAG: hypothetical protein WCA56_21995 [Xanthobacteraceae bacterium]
MIKAAENLPHALNRGWRVWIDHGIYFFSDSRRKRGDLGAAGDQTRCSAHWVGRFNCSSSFAMFAPIRPAS